MLVLAIVGCKTSCCPLRYYLDSLNNPLIMDDPECAAITEKAYSYFKLSYQEKVGSNVTVAPCKV